MTPFCAGEDSWLARCSTSDPSTSKVRDENGKSRCSKNNKRRNKEDSPKSTAVHAGFPSSWPGQQKPPSKGARDELSSLNKILDQICQIHSTPGKPTNHTHRECWVKQSGKLNAVHKGEDTPSEDEDEPLKQDTGEQKKFPPEVKTVDVLHVIKGRNKTALPEKYAQGPITAESCHWSSQPITFDHRDYPASIRRAGWAALVLDPIINGYHFTRVLMDGGSSLNLIYQDTIREMGIDPTKICQA